MKQEFIDFLNALMEAAPEVAEAKMTEGVKAYIEALKGNKTDKPVLTDNGKMILDYMQKSDAPMFKSRDVAEGLFISSRAVSGAFRKLVNDGFCEKVGQDPVVYTLTEKGKNFKIEEEEN
jgi:predicted transcriptional regulator